LSFTFLPVCFNESAISLAFSAALSLSFENFFNSLKRCKLKGSLTLSADSCTAAVSSSVKSSLIAAAAFSSRLFCIFLSFRFSSNDFILSLIFCTKAFDAAES